MAEGGEDFVFFRCDFAEGFNDFLQGAVHGETLK